MYFKGRDSGLLAYIFCCSSTHTMLLKHDWFHENTSQPDKTSSYCIKTPYPMSLQLRELQASHTGNERLTVLTVIRSNFCFTVYFNHLFPRSQRKKKKRPYRWISSTQGPSLPDLPSSPLWHSGSSLHRASGQAFLRSTDSRASAWAPWNSLATDSPVGKKRHVLGDRLDHRNSFSFSMCYHYTVWQMGNSRAQYVKATTSVITSNATIIGNQMKWGVQENCSKRSTQKNCSEIPASLKGF